MCFLSGTDSIVLRYSEGTQQPTPCEGWPSTSTDALQVLKDDEKRT
jgi:hypothetical protein